MPLFKSVQATRGDVPITADRASDIVFSFGDYTVVGTEVQNDVIEMAALPAGYVPVDIIVDTEDCGTTLTIDCGVLSQKWLDGNSPARTCGAEFMNDKAFGTAGIYRADVVGMSRVAPSTNDRSIGFKVDAAISTLTAGAKIRLTALLRPQIEGV